MQKEHKIELLQAEVADDDESYFRLLVDGNIKYLTIDPDLYDPTGMTFGPSLFALLPPFPPGDWNDALVAKDPESGQPVFARALRTQFPSIKHTWHARTIDYADLVIGKKLRTGIYEVTSQHFAGTAVAKFARFEFEIGYLENETRAYEWIDGHGIGPRFLAHLTEDNGGRVIGFLMERIVNARHAGPDPEDLAACQGTLSKLHSLGIRHGDINRFNFLIETSSSRAVLIDFDTARESGDRDVLREEYGAFQGYLGSKDTKGGGGLLCVDTS